MAANQDTVEKFEGSRVFDELERRIKLIQDLTADNGQLHLMRLDLVDVLQSEDFPMEHAHHYIARFLECVIFVHEEGWLLSHGQCSLPVHEEDHQEFIVDGIFAFVTKDHEMSSRFSKRKNRPMSACSLDGVIYLAQKKIRVSLFRRRCVVSVVVVVIVVVHSLIRHISSGTFTFGRFSY